MLAIKLPTCGSDVTKYGVDTPADMANSPEIGVDSDTFSCTTATVNDVHHNGDKKNTGELGALSDEPDCSSKHYELTVLDSQKQHAKDDTGMLW